MPIPQHSFEFSESEIDDALDNALTPRPLAPVIPIFSAKKGSVNIPELKLSQVEIDQLVQSGDLDEQIMQLINATNLKLDLPNDPTSFYQILANKVGVLCKIIQAANDNVDPQILDADILSYREKMQKQMGFDHPVLTRQLNRLSQLLILRATIEGLQNP